MRLQFFSLLSAAALAVSSSALADPAYTSEDIVRFFVESADLGAARGICIGTAQECDRNAPKPAGFDMMINFSLDSATLTEEARVNLEQFARALKDDRLKAAKFVVEGHTDAIGSDSYNDGLAERRANSVEAFLLEYGVPKEKISAVGMGKRSPRVDDPYDPVNRRVEMRVNLQ